jgi:hypothetical protein
LILAAKEAGQFTGLGDFRPQFGRFNVIAIDGKPYKGA